MSGSAGQQVAIGDRFSIQSRRGTSYEMTLLGIGSGLAGYYVRLPDDRLARLDPAKLNWSSRRSLGPNLEALVRPGDLVRLRLLGESVRGRVLSWEASAIHLAASEGGPRTISRSDLVKAWLLFRASDMKEGDHLILRSRSGNEYEGTFLRHGPDRVLEISLPAGDRLCVREARLDEDGFFVLVPIELGLLG